MCICAASNIEIRTKRAIEREVKDKNQEANGAEMGYQDINQIDRITDKRE